MSDFEQWVPLSDVQWMNIVNYDHAWYTYSKEGAVHEAVKMTEAKCRENNAAIASMQGEAPKGFALVPIVTTRAMDDVMREPDWQWIDVLAAAESISEDDYFEPYPPRAAEKIAEQDARIKELEQQLEVARRDSLKNANGCVLREYEQSHTVQGQSVVDNIPLRHECNGASDYCMHCGIDVYDEKGLEPCDGLEKVRRSQINPSTVTAFGCEKESEGLETCKQWCQGLHCPYVRTEVYAALSSLHGEQAAKIAEQDARIKELEQQLEVARKDAIPVEKINKVFEDWIKTSSSYGFSGDAENYEQLRKDILSCAHL